MTKQLHSALRVIFLPILVLLCCVQLSQTAHVHHAHDVAERIVDISVQDHDHQHSEPLPSEPIEHEHQLKKKADWNHARTRTVVKSDIDVPLLRPIEYSLPVTAFIEEPFALPTSRLVERIFCFSLVIRGPPQTS